MDTDLYVLLPTHGRSTLLRRTLESLAAFTPHPSLVATRVIENGPPGGAEEVVQSLKESAPHLRIEYVHSSRANKSEALNVALQGLPGSALCVMIDDDIRVAPGFMEAYVAAYAEHGDRAFYGGPCDVDYEVAPDPDLIPFFPPSAKGIGIERLIEKKYFLGCNWAASAGVLRAAGGFDPLYGPGSPTGATGQETELQGRLRARGLVMAAVPEALVWHYVPADRSSRQWLVERLYRVGRSAGQAKRDGKITAGARGLSRLGQDVLVTMWAGLRGDRRQLIARQLGVARQWGYIAGLLNLQ